MTYLIHEACAYLFAGVRPHCGGGIKPRRKHDRIPPDPSPGYEPGCRPTHSPRMRSAGRTLLDARSPSPAASPVPRGHGNHPAASAGSMQRPGRTHTRVAANYAAGVREPPRREVSWAGAEITEVARQASAQEPVGKAADGTEAQYPCGDDAPRPPRAQVADAYNATETVRLPRGCEPVSVKDMAGNACGVGPTLSCLPTR